MPVAILRPAATVVVGRRAPLGDSFDILLVRRNDKVAFMGGAYVFPGGRVDESDEAAAAMAHPPAATRFDDLTPVGEQAFRHAAVRELLEEASVTVEPSALVPFAHWVTPEIETRRYDTRFFLVEMPDGQDARHDQDEMTDLRWMSPADAIARCVAHEIMLPPPTWTTLKQFARFGSLSHAFDWARSRRIVRVQPAFLRDERRTMLTLPGDPTYPTIDGWEVPEDTRFLLQEGRWLPVNE
jgi:8-oxo-dGTP pyrophosphatase MutT (NUDIX family)